MKGAWHERGPLVGTVESYGMSGEYGALHQINQPSPGDQQPL